jgi:thiol-disulfide isomerase/thioredoxin
MDGQSRTLLVRRGGPPGSQIAGKARIPLFVRLPNLLFWVSAGLLLAGMGQPAFAVNSMEPPPSRATPSEEGEPADNTAVNEAEAEPFVLVEGQITDPIGAGVRGAKVSAYEKNPDGGRGDLLSSAETDHMGDFKVLLDEPFYGDIIVTMEKEPFKPLAREVHVVESEYPEFLGEWFVGTLVLTGKVISALTEKPLLGVKVSLETSYRGWTTETDEKGAFRIEELSPGEGMLTIEADGFGREQLHVVSIRERTAEAEEASTEPATALPTDDTPAEFSDFIVMPKGGLQPGDELSLQVVVKLKPERIVHLTVVNDADQPVAAAAVESFDEPRMDYQTVITDQQGKAVLRKVHFDAKALALRIHHEDHVSSEQFDRDILLPSDEIESEHRIVLQRAGEISGQVIDAVTREPLNGARVIAGETYSDFTPRDWADHEGRYTLRGVGPGPCLLTVHLSGFAPELAEVEVKIGETTTKDFRLEPCAVLRGTVKTKDGKPVPHVQVEAGEWRGHLTLGLRAITDEEGAFVIEEAPHDEFELSVLAGGRRQATQTVKAGDSPIEFVLSEIPSAPGMKQITALKVGEEAPDVTLKTLDGRVLKLPELKGKVVLIDFWATWCGPCLEEIPSLVAVYKEYGSREDFVMIGVSLDFDEQPLREFVKKNAMAWQEVYGEAGGVQKAADAFGVSAIPALFIIGRDGKIAAADLRGPQVAGELRKILKNSNEP